jgi:hypothetical protein
MVEFLLIIFLTVNCLVVWFKTNFRAHLLKRFKAIPEDLFLPDEVQTYLIINKGLLGDLLTCPVCLGTWVATFWAFYFLFFGSLPFLLILPAIFSVQLLASHV